MSLIADLLESTLDAISTTVQDHLPEDPTKVLRVTVAKGAKAPTRSHDTDAGLDLYAHGYYQLDPHLDRVKVNTGVAAAIPAGYVGLLFPRSSMYQHYSGAMLTNCVGVIDSSYRGPIIASLRPGHHPEAIHDGDKIVQLVLLPIITPAVMVVDSLDETDRGTGGFGSTGGK